MATTGYASALGGLAKDAVIGAGKGFVGGLKGAMMSEAPGITGAYAFGKELRKRANAPKMSSGGSAPPASNKSSSSSPMAGGLGTSNDKSIVGVLRQSNIINLEQVSQLKQLNANVINQSKLLKFTVDDTKRKDQFAEEVAKEQAFRDDALLDAIRNIGSGGGGGKRGGGEAANDSSSGGFLSSLLGGAAGGAMSKLVPLLSAAMAALPWAKILKLAGPASLAVNTLSLPGSTPNKKTEEEYSKWYASEEYKREAAEKLAAFEKEMFRKNDEAKAKRIAAGTAVEARPKHGDKGNWRAAAVEWDKKNKGKFSDDGELKTAAPPPAAAAPGAAPGAPAGTKYALPVGNGRVSSGPGPRVPPVFGASANHQGTDVAAEVGTRVNSIGPGRVTGVFTGDSKKGLGRFVEITHDNGLISKYGHLSKVSVSMNDQVAISGLLGYSGGDPSDPGSGASSGAHVHIEATRDGKNVDLKTLSGLEVLGTVGNYMQGRATQNVRVAAAPTPGPAKGNSPASTASAASASAYDPMKPAGWTPPPLGGAANLVAPRPFQNDLHQFQNLLGGAKAVAPKSTSTNPEIDAKKKIIIDAVEEFKRTILKGLEDYLKGIKNLKDKIGDSNSAVDSNVIAGYDLNLPLLAKQTNIQANPNAHVTALPAGHPLFGIAKVTSDAGQRGGKADIDLNAGDSAKDYDRFHKIQNRRIDENIARIEDERKADIDLNAGDSARDIDRFNKIENRRINEKIAEIEEQRKREFLTSEKSSYTTAGVEVSKESNPLVAFIERLLLIFRGERSSSVKLDPYFDNMHVNDLFRKTEREFRVESDKLASGTILDKGPISVEDEALLKELIKNNKVLKGTGGPAKLLPSYVDKSGKLILATAPPPFKPNFRGNTQILAEANKQFLNELRSTFTGLAKKGLQDALLPNGVGVSFAQASQDNLFRGEQLKQINDTSKKINEGAVKLFGNKFGPMFAPMLDKLSTSYFEVGSRLVGRQLFTRFGGLDDKETMGITGQVLGNIAAGKKQLAAEQLLFGMSGGRERGIALNAESLFAKYGFEDSQQGISYFADVLGEKATQPFSKVFGADDRNKSIVRDPRTGKSVYVDSGKEATKDDIKAGYGGRISQTPLLGKENEYMEVPGHPGSVAGTGGPPDQYAIFDAKGKIIGRKAGGMTNSSVTGGSFGGAASKATGTPMQQYTKVPDGKGGVVNPTQADLLGITPKQFNSDLEKNTLLAEGVKAQLQQNARAEGIRHAEAIKAEAKIAADAATNSGDQALAAKITAEAAAKANEIITIKGAEVVVDGVSQAVGGGKDDVASGSDTPGLKASGRRPGQLFDANVYDKDGKIEGKDPMKEIGNFGFDILKLGVGSEMTKGISNPYMQTIANFAIQKGMNSAIEAIMGTGGGGGIFSKIGSMFSGGSSSYGGYGGGTSGGGIFETVLSFIGFQTGGVVTGPGTGTSDSIPAYLSNGEFVVNAKAAAANMQLLNAINQSTLPKKNKSGSGTYIDDRGGGQDPTPSPWSDMTNSQKAAYFDVNPVMAKIDAIVDAIVGFTSLGTLMNFFDPTGKNERAAIRGGFQSYSDFKSSMGAFADAKVDAAKFSGLTGKTARESELNAEKADQAAQQNSTGKNSWGKSGDADQDVGGTSSVSTATPGEKGGEHLAKGGLITGKGSGTSDSIFSMLSNGEFVINAKATKANLALLKQINSYSGSGSVPKSEYERNLSIEPFDNKFKGFADGGLVTASTMNAVPKLTSRSPYILSPPTNNSSSENQNNSSNMIIGPKTSTRIDNSSVTNFYNQASGMIDSIRSITPQVA